jgi:putative hydrolase of the HAD superfamily
MKHIKAIGFDLFGTLIFVDKITQDDALKRLVKILRENGFEIDFEEFVVVYSAAVIKFMEQARQNHKETHNRYWICETLRQFGYDVVPGDPRISDAIETYFEEFIAYMELLPGTIEMLGALRKHYQLGLLSNFTHAPAVRDALANLGLAPYLDFILISGESGHRKPGAEAYSQLIKNFGVSAKLIAFAGDDPVADLQGALNAGIQPIWTHYASLHTGRTISDLALTANTGIPIIKNWDELLALLKIPA